MLRIVIAFSLLLVMFAGSSRSEDPARINDRSIFEGTGEILLEIDVEKSGDLLLLPIMINGRSVQFAVDTGAAVNVLDEGFVSQVGRLVRSRKPYPAGFPDMFELPESTIGSSKICLTGDFCCADLKAMRAACGHDFVGIIGINFLKDYVIQVDCDRGKFRILESVDVSPKVGLQVFRDQFDRPLLPVEILDGIKTRMMIDTGMVAPGLGELKQSLFEELLEADRVKIKGPPAKLATTEGELVHAKGILDRLKIGKSEHKELAVRRGTTNAIGMDLLSRYVFTLDLINDMIYLEQGCRFDDETVFDMSGMVLIREENVTNVLEVHPLGPAHATGIKAGDQLIRVGDKKVDEYSLLKLRRLLGLKNRHVQVTIKREKKFQEFELLLKDWQHVATRDLNTSR